MSWKPAALVLCGSLWTLAVGAGLVQLADHAGTPGQAAAAVSQRPANTRLRFNPAGPTVILFAHPHCPCTRTSLDALTQILAGARGECRVQVVFWVPAGATGSWAHGASWDRADRIPGGVVQVDPGGAEARNFGAETSGQVFVYDRMGRLRFAGGITPARGHAGASKGARALRALLADQESEDTSAPVFGCSLFSD